MDNRLDMNFANEVEEYDSSINVWTKTCMELWFWRDVYLDLCFRRYMTKRVTHFLFFVLCIY
jgi:hypothetical protein